MQLESIKAVDPQVHSSHMEHRLIASLERQDAAFSTVKKIITMSIARSEPHIEVDSQVMKWSP